MPDESPDALSERDAASAALTSLSPSFFSRIAPAKIRFVALRAKDVPPGGNSPHGAGLAARDLATRPLAGTMLPLPQKKTLQSHDDTLSCTHHVGITYTRGQQHEYEHHEHVNERPSGHPQ